jgi:tetratricopeptide (TPR) repeat protein
MERHQRTNTIIAWVLGAVAFVVYMMTTCPVVSFWDNGEFVAVGYTLGVGHPPGSPVYTLISRLFSLLPFPNVVQAVNFTSIVAATLAVVLFYLALTKMAKRWEGRVESFEDGLPTYVTGITACLFMAFSFSFWENALEAEVYATNILVMAATLWMTLRWSELRGDPRDRRYLFLIIYLLALGIGVHMGSLLWAPAFLLFIILFETRYVGLFLLALPLGMMFFMLSKGAPWGAYGIGLLWLITTLYYAVPAMWPSGGRGPGRGARRRAKKEGRKEVGAVHPASKVPPAMLWTLVVIELVALLATGTNQGSVAIGWFLLSLVVSVGAVYLYAYLIRLEKIDRPEIPARMVFGAVVLSVLALSVHAYLLIRARLDPAINESDPDTWKVVFDVMRRKQYEPMRFFPRRTPFSNQFRILWSYLRPQFTVWPLLLSVWGAVVHARRDRKSFALLALAFAAASVGLLFYLNISDHEVRSREYFWVPMYVGLALWMGIGSGALVRMARKLGKAGLYAAAIVLILLSLWPLQHHYHRMDRSENYVAHYYGWNLLNFLEEDAILITNGDNDTFPLWYLQEVEDVRRDVEVVNLSLVQINWYVRQLKERGLPLSFSFEEIEKMHPYWARDPDTGQLRLVTLRDITIHDLIRENNWERPVYFAVTVDDFMGYDDHLELEGMVFKMVQTEGRYQINAEKTRENCFENYRYDSIIDKDDNWRVIDEVYKNETYRRLITNYAAGFSRLAFDEMQARPPDVEEAMKLYQIALKFAPTYGPALNGLIAIYAVRMYEPERALPLVERLLESQPQNTESWVRHGGVYLMVAEELKREGRREEAKPYYQTALGSYEEALRREPERREIYPAVLTIYEELGLEDRIDRLLGLWQRYDPEGLQQAIQGSGEGPGGRE